MIATNLRRSKHYFWELSKIVTCQADGLHNLTAFRRHRALFGITPFITKIVWGRIYIRLQNDCVHGI